VRIALVAESGDWTWRSGTDRFCPNTLRKTEGRTNTRPPYATRLPITSMVFLNRTFNSCKAAEAPTVEWKNPSDVSLNARSRPMDIDFTISRFRHSHFHVFDEAFSSSMRRAVAMCCVGREWKSCSFHAQCSMRDSNNFLSPPTLCRVVNLHSVQVTSPHDAIFREKAYQQCPPSYPNQLKPPFKMLRRSILALQQFQKYRG
jgi:hypothetical protein